MIANINEMSWKYLVIIIRLDIYRFGPRHNKTNKMSVHPAKTDQPGHPSSLIRVFAGRIVTLLVLSRRGSFVLTHCAKRPILGPFYNVVSGQDLHCLLTGISIKNKVKMKKYTMHP